MYGRRMRRGGLHVRYKDSLFGKLDKNMGELLLDILVSIKLVGY